MPKEPDPKLHHIFATFQEAQEFYLGMVLQYGEVIKPPRQSHGDTWILDKVE